MMRRAIPLASSGSMSWRTRVTSRLRISKPARRRDGGGHSFRAQAAALFHRKVTRYEKEEVLDRMAERLAARPDILDTRRETVEHLCGSIKQWMGQGAFLMKRLENVRAEFSLTALAYNIRRAIIADNKEFSHGLHRFQRALSQRGKILILIGELYSKLHSENGYGFEREKAFSEQNGGLPSYGTFGTFMQTDPKLPRRPCATSRAISRRRWK